MAKTLPITEVKTHLPELVTGVAEREEVFDEPLRRAPVKRRR